MLWAEPHSHPHPAGSVTAGQVTGAHHLLTLLCWSPPLCKIPSQKKKVPLSCWVGRWAQLPRGTRAEDICFGTSVGRKEWVRRKQLLVSFSGPACTP